MISLFLQSYFTVGCPVHLQTSYQIRTGMFCKELGERDPWFKMNERTRGQSVPP